MGSLENEQRSYEWMALLIICIAVVAVLGRCTTFAFTNWDDSTFLLENRLLQQHTLATFKQLWVPGSVPEEQLYIPITYLSYWLESAAFGLDPKVCHAVNLVLHLGNCLLLFALLRRLQLKWIVVLLATLLFAVHPLQAEAVSWCMGRKDLLATFLALCSILLFVVYTEHSKRWQILIPTALLACLAMLAKPSALVLPAMLAVVASYKIILQKKAVIVCLVAISIAAIALYFVTGGLAPPTAPDAPRLWYRALLAPSALADAALRFVFLKHVSAYYQWPASMVIAGIKTIGFIIGSVCFLLWIRRKESLVAPALTLVIACLPVLGALIQHRTFFGADRYFYLPMAAMAWLVAALLDRVPRRRRSVVQVVVCCGLGIAACLAFRASGVWQNSLTLWQPISAQQPGNSTAHNNLGNALDTLGRIRESAEAYTRATEADPENFKAWSNLSDAHVKLEQYDEAIAAGRTATAISPGYYEGLHNLGLAYLRAGRPEDAAKEFRNALIVKPNQAPTINLMGVAFLQQKEPGKAALCFRKALSLQDSVIAYRLNLVQALIASGQRELALAELDIVLRQNPGNPTALELQREAQSPSPDQSQD